jgi:competence protein ComEC
MSSEPYSYLVFILLVLFLYKKAGVMYSILLLFLMCLSSVLQISATSNDLCGKVIDVKDIVTIIKIQKSEYTLFDQKGLSLDDKICVVGKVVPVKAGSTFVDHPIMRWSNQRNHRGSIDVEHIEVIEKGNTIKSRLFDRIGSIDSSGWLKAYLFGHSAPITGHFTSLFVSSGLIASSLVTLLRKLLGYFFTEKIRQKITSCVLILCLPIWGGSFVLSRIFINDISRYLKLKPLGRVSLAYACLLIIYPYHLMHPAYIIPLSLSMIHIFNYPKFLSRMALLPLIQTSIMYRFDFLTALMFPLFRIVALVGYLFAWLCTLFPTFLPHFVDFCEVLSYNDRSFITKFRMTGHPSIMLSIVWSFALFYTRLAKKQLFLRLLVLVSLFQVRPYIDPLTTVTFFNVGQADSALIQLPYNQGNWLIDTGRSGTSSLLRANLWYRGISHLDAIFISHQDNDHSGGITMLMKDFSIGEIIEKPVDFEQKGFVLYSLLESKENLSDNDNSLVHLFSINGFTYLFLGDISKNREVELIRKHPFLKADIIKLAHHGSKTSTSEELMANTQPRLTIISADPRTYGHPHKETLKTLWQFQIPYLSTHQTGDIRISTLGNFHLVMSSSGGFGIMKTVIK